MLYNKLVGNALPSCSKKNEPTTKNVPAIPITSNNSAITQLSFFHLKYPHDWPNPWEGLLSFIETAKPGDFNNVMG